MQENPVIDQSSIAGDDEIDMTLLRQMALKAESYVRSFAWCERLIEGKFVDGYGGIFALFLFRADIKKLGSSVLFWVFAGGVPSAYLEVKDFPTSALAAKRYLNGVSEWISAVRNGESTDDLIPIESPKDTETLTRLELKLRTIQSEFLEFFSDEPVRLSNND